MPLAESTIELVSIDWIQELGYQIAFGPGLALDGCAPERHNYQFVLST
jgi:hypothetical protein